MSSREELIARRDELIDSIQGEWVIRAGSGAANRSGLVLGLATLIALLLLSLPPIAVITLLDSGSGWRDFLDASLVFSLFGLVMGAVVYFCVHARAALYRRMRPMVVRGSELLWNKRDGHVPERVDLHSLSQVVHYQVAAFVGLSRATIGLFRGTTNRGEAAPVEPCMLMAPGDLNAPWFTPGMFEDGVRLLATLKRIAELNSSLEALRQGD